MTALHLGDRVQVHIQGQDQLDLHRGETLGCSRHGLPMPIVGHTPEHEGRVGTIQECTGGFPCQYGAALGHPYFVLYDTPYLFEGKLRHGGHFAEGELVKADAD